MRSTPPNPFRLLSFTSVVVTSLFAVAPCLVAGCQAPTPTPPVDVDAGCPTPHDALDGGVDDGDAGVPPVDAGSHFDGGTTVGHEHCGVIAEDTTWQADAVHHVRCDVRVAPGATLHVEGGAEVRFAPYTTLRIDGRFDDPGVLQLSGGAPVLMHSTEQEPFAGLRILPHGQANVIDLRLHHAGAEDAAIVVEGRLQMSGSTIEHNATDGIVLRHGGDLDLSDTSVGHNGGVGLRLESGGHVTGAIDNVDLHNNAGVPVVVDGDLVETLAPSSAFVDNSDDRIVVTGNVQTVTTWHALEAPYFAPNGLSVHLGGELTLADGVEVQFGVNKSLWLGQSYSNDGSLHAEGGALGIEFTVDADQPQQRWGGIVDHNILGGSIDLERTTLHRAGAVGATEAALTLNGNGARLTEVVVEESGGHGVIASGAVSMHTCEVRGSASDGVRVLDDELVEIVHTQFVDNGARPLVIPAGSVGALGDSNTYAGNGVSAIRVVGGHLLDDTTWHAQGVLLELVTPLVVGGPASPTLTLAAGVHLDISPGLRAGLSQPAAFRVDGTREHPVVLQASDRHALSSTFSGLLDLGPRLDTSSSWMHHVEHDALVSDDPFLFLNVFGSLALSDVAIAHRDTTHPGAAIVVNHGEVSLQNVDVQRYAIGVHVPGEGRVVDATGLSFAGVDVPFRVTADSVAAILDGDASFGVGDAQTLDVLGGALTESASWSASDWTVRLTGLLEVGGAQGVDLYLGAGFRLDVGGYSRLNVGTFAPGRLLVDGTASDRVVLSSTDTAWGGIRLLEHSDGSYLNYATIHNAGAQIPSAAVVLQDTDANLGNVIVSDSRGVGLFARGHTGTLTNMSYSNNAGVNEDIQ